ncbi:MAG: hypothetical protein CMJ31_04900 [Phycisphaerae bacterium]|nr:hypothetical protein [Phycisphaerae bacterium]
MPSLTRTVACAVAALLTLPTAAMPAETREKGRELATRAIEYLRSQQDEETGGWAITEGRPDLRRIGEVTL